MRCKVGDLAILIRSETGKNIGKICTVLARCDDEKWLVRFQAPIEWTTGPDLVGAQGICPDAWLRPLRDDPGTDEMLRIAGNPIHEEIKRLNDKLTEALERIERVRQDVKEQAA